MKASIKEIREKLQELGLDGWLLYVFRDTNPVADSMLGLQGLRSRRCFYWIPVKGEPVRLQHRIEPHTLAGLPGEDRSYLSYTSLREELAAMLAGAGRVAMEYSPMAEIPTVSWVDGGTIDLIRSLRVEVCSSAELVQYFEATLDDEQMEGHLRAAVQLRDIAAGAFARAGEHLASGQALKEYDLQQWILQEFDRRGLQTDHPPIVAQGPHAGDPHYEPSPEHSALLEKDQLLLIDLWAREKADHAVYADETWMGWTGPGPVPEVIQTRWEITRDAREAALALVVEGLQAGRRVEGREVDRAARDLIDKAGYGEAFIHRTGHSMHTVDHANGANMDDLESRETRPLIPRTLFSIEPGIYLPEMGFRSEIDVLVDAEGQAVVAEGTRQFDLIRCL